MELDDALALVERIYSRLDARRPEILKFEDYTEGRQPLTFATEEWKRANASRYRDFSDNWAGPVVAAEAERLKPIGITNLPKRGAQMLWDHLQANEFDMQFASGVSTILTARRAFVIVWADEDGQPMVTFEHPSDVEIEYDWENPRLRKAALKSWVDEKTEFATLYTATEIWKFKRGRTTMANDFESQATQSRTGYGPKGGWEKREVADESWPLRNTLGVVPVVEIANRHALKGDPISEVEGVIPMQDAINLLWAYLFLAADYASMPARVLLGTDPPKIPILDSDGKVVGSRPVDMKDLAEKRFLSLTGDNAKIDQFDAAKLDVFTDTIEVMVGHIAAQTRTPPTYLVSKTGMSNVNGEGLKASEIGINKKAGEFITFADPNLREVARLIALVLGDEKLAMACRLAHFDWENPEIRSEAQLADALLKKKQIGYPIEFLLEQDGQSPSTIKRIMGLIQAEQDSLLGLGVQAAADATGE